MASRSGGALGNLLSSTPPLPVNQPPETAAAALAAAFGLSSLDCDEPDTFAPADAFRGPKPGWVFKHGELGLGYYVDEPLHAAALQIAALSFSASTQFAGPKPGWVFKTDTLGTGYYRDTPSTSPPKASSTGTKASLRTVPRGGFVFGGDNRGRTFRAYCESASARGDLTSEQVDALYDNLAKLPDGAREGEMLATVEAGLRGKLANVVGATGRTSRGWWGDGSVGFVLPDGIFDAKRPDLLPVRIPLRSAALGQSLGEAVIPEVMDVGIRATNLRLPMPPAVAKASASKAHRPADALDPASGTGTLGHSHATPALDRAGRPPADLPTMLSQFHARCSPRCNELFLADSDGRRVEDATAEESDNVASHNWARMLRPHVHRVRLSVEHLWSGPSKTRLIARCCELDILQCMKPVSAWPGQGPPADYVTNLGAVTRAGDANPQLAAWESEARSGGACAEDFAKLLELRAGLTRRGVRVLERFDSLFMRLYAARAAIPAHRDEGGRRLRIVGNSGQDRGVSFVPQAIGDLNCVDVESAPRLGYTVEHGWAYLLTDAGAGRSALRADVDASSLALGMDGPRRGLVDLVVAHAAQPTSKTAPLTMAWVLDVDVESCGGDVATIVRNYEEAVLEVMIAHSVSLDEAMQPPELPNPFLYRPLEAGRAASKSPASGRDWSAGQHLITGDTKYLMQVECRTCRARHWLPADEASGRTLQITCPSEFHAPSCSHAATKKPIRLCPVLRKVRKGYRLWGDGGNEGKGRVGVEAAAHAARSGLLVRLQLRFVKGHAPMEVRETQVVAEQD